MIEKESSNYFTHFIAEARERQVVIFGASSAGVTAERWLRNNDISVVGFSDNDQKKWATTFLNKPVLSPDEMIGKIRNGAGFVVLIASDFSREIRPQLDAVIKDSVYHLSKFGGFDNVLYDPKPIINNEESIGKLRLLVDDDRSREVIQNILDYRMKGEITKLDKIYDKEIFKKDFLTLSETEVILDAGAYDGDSIFTIDTELEGVFKKIYAFEPDPENYKKLQNMVVGTSIAEKVELVQLGLYDENTTLAFSSDGTTESSVKEDGDIKVEVTRLDDFKDAADITYIKMDIEGSEMAALKGAKETIIAHKPKLAICIYHKAKDLWEIPFYIKELVPDYSIFIRHNTCEIYDTMCYAIPKK
ncbi:MAG: FkbM family methyltransferase [Fibrobacterales bacterium]